MMALMAAPASVHAQSTSPGSDAPADSTPSPDQGIPANESGTVAGGGSSGGGAASPGGSKSGGASTVTLVVIVLAVVIGIGAVVVSRQRRLEQEGVT